MEGGGWRVEGGGWRVEGERGVSGLQRVAVSWSCSGAPEDCCCRSKPQSRMDYHPTRRTRVPSMSAIASAPLPAGWHQITSGGSCCYSNAVTGHSQIERPAQLQRHRCFPDPDPLPAQQAPLADDVSGFNGASPTIHRLRACDLLR